MNRSHFGMTAALGPAGGGGREYHQNREKLQYIQGGQLGRILKTQLRRGSVPSLIKGSKFDIFKCFFQFFAGKNRGSFKPFSKVTKTFFISQFLF